MYGFYPLTGDLGLAKHTKIIASGPNTNPIAPQNTGLSPRDFAIKWQLITLTRIAIIKKYIPITCYSLNPIKHLLVTTKRLKHLHGEDGGNFAAKLITALPRRFATLLHTPSC